MLHLVFIKTTYKLLFYYTQSILFFSLISLLCLLLPSHFATDYETCPLGQPPSTFHSFVFYPCCSWSMPHASQLNQSCKQGIEGLQGHKHQGVLGQPSSHKSLPTKGTTSMHQAAPIPPPPGPTIPLWHRSRWYYQKPPQPYHPYWHQPCSHSADLHRGHQYLRHMVTFDKPHTLTLIHTFTTMGLHKLQSWAYKIFISLAVATILTLHTAYPHPAGTHCQTPNTQTPTTSAISSPVPHVSNLPDSTQLGHPDLAPSSTWEVSDRHRHGNH